MGGGTFDVSVVNVDYGVFDILATAGDSNLGGEDFDWRVVEHFINMYKYKKGKDIRTDNTAVQRLRREVEKAKHQLSTTQQAKIEIRSFVDEEDFSETLTRSKFEELNMVSSSSSTGCSSSSSSNNNRYGIISTIVLVLLYSMRQCTWISAV